MSEPDVVPVNTPEPTPAPAGNTGDGTQAEPKDGEGQKPPQKPEETVEFWKERYTNEQRKINELAEANKTKERELDTLKTQADLARAVADLAKSKEEVKKPVDYNRFIDELGDEIVTDPKGALRKLTSTFNAWMAEDRDRTAGEVKAAKAEIDKLRSELNETIERKDSFYETNKELIDELVTGGMKLANAKSFVKDKMAKYKDVAPREPIPASVSSPRSAPPAPKSGYFANQSERARWEKDFGKEAVEYLEQEHERNLKAQEEIERRKAGV